MSQAKVLQFPKVAQISPAPIIRKPSRIIALAQAQSVEPPRTGIAKHCIPFFVPKGAA